MTEWMPIESAPKDGSVVLAYCPEAVRICSSDMQVWTWPEDAALNVVPVRWHEPNGRTSDEAGWYAPFNFVLYGVWDDPSTDVYPVSADPTHWMPLPDPPSAFPHSGFIQPDHGGTAG